MHTQETKDRAIELYFKIEQHIVMGGDPLSLRDIGKMAGRSSSASCQLYVKVLEGMGLIKRISYSPRTITLAQKNYPPVFYRKNVMRGE